MIRFLVYPKDEGRVAILINIRMLQRLNLLEIMIFTGDIYLIVWASVVCIFTLCREKIDGNKITIPHNLGNKSKGDRTCRKLGALIEKVN